MKRQVKNLLPIILAASVATAANAEGSFEGFYLGAGIGGSITTGKSNAATSFVTTDTATGAVLARGFTSFDGHHGGKGQFAGSLFAGYGCPVWDPVYIGAEIFVTGNGRHGSGNTITDSYTAAGVTSVEGFTVRPRNRNWNWGIDFRPGIMLCQESMLYFRVGASWHRHGSRFAVFRTVSPATPGLTVNPPLGTREFHRHKNRANLRLGVGLEQAICDCWTLRADYVYTQSRRASGSAVTRFVSPVLGTTVVATDSFSSKLRNHTAMLGVSYYFN